MLHTACQLVQGKQADTNVMESVVDDQGAAVSLAACMATERASLCQVHHLHANDMLLCCVMVHPCALK